MSEVAPTPSIGSANPPRPAAPGVPAGKFTTGSTLRHVVVMSATGAVGLMAIFVVDFLNLFYISLLGRQELTAAVGYASALFFFLTSIGIGLSIGIAALVSRALGGRDRERARRLSASGLILVTIFMTVVSAAIALALPVLVTWLGAEGATRLIAERFLLMTLPSTPFLGIGMALSSILRAVGDARRAMWVTLGGAIAAAILDPILIFGMGLGIDGAAIATVLARIAFAAIGAYGAVHVHHLVAKPQLRDLPADALALSAIALPAILTNIATPTANGYVTSALSAHGEPAVAAWTVIGRLSPLAFAGIFALSAAIGPIIGQNLGARHIDRVRAVITNSLFLTLAYVLAVWAVLIASENAIIGYFAASDEAGQLIRFYCEIVSGTFLFMGGLFVANAAFNTLGSALLATAFNWGRATLGTIPFVMIGGHMAGAKGVMLGQGVGGIVFGIAAVATAYWVIGRLDRSTAR